LLLQFIEDHDPEVFGLKNIYEQSKLGERVKKIFVGVLIICSFAPFSFAQVLSFGSPNVVTTDLPLAKRIIVVDLDQDGDMDIVSSSSNTNTIDANVAWFENTGSGFTKHDIDTDFQSARTVGVGDLDDDGEIDVVGTNRIATPLTWWENNTWVSNEVVTGSDTSQVLQVVDLDQDGYMDMLTGIGVWPDTSPSKSLVWVKNSSVSPGTFTIDTLNQNWQNIIRINPTDIDFDGDLDIVFADVGIADETANDGVIWLENDGLENFTEREIDTGTDAPMYVYSGDVDNDGDQDVLVTLWGHVDGTLHYAYIYENDGKDGDDPTKTWDTHGVDGNFYNGRSAEFHDLDGDGFLDVVGAGSDDFGIGNGPDGGYVTYWINDGTPLDGGWARTDIADDFDYAYHAVTEDMDDDGDLDIVASSQDLGDIQWWENLVSDDLTNISASTDYNLWNSKIRVNFSSGPSGTEYLKAFYNAGEVPDTSLLGVGIDSIVANGFYTLKTNVSSYTQDLEFSYAGISEWTDVNTEAELILCYWSGTQWEKASNQSVSQNASADSILVRNFTRIDNSSVLWTLGYLSVYSSTKTIASGDQPVESFDPTDISMDFSTSPGGDVTVDLYFTNPLNAGLNTIAKYWDVSSTMTNGTFTLDLEFTYDDNDTIGLIEEALIPVYYDATESRWKRLLDYELDAATNTIIVYNLDHFTQFAIGESNSFGMILSDVDIFLEGAFNNTDMDTVLINNDYIPLSQPYNTSPWNYTGVETVANIPLGVVDWILIEIRTSTDALSVVSQRACFLMYDGTIADTDGISSVSFDDISAGNYYIVIHHRNHLPVMTAVTQSLSTSSSLYNFIDGINGVQFFGGSSGAVELSSDIWGMITGDANGNGQVQNDDKNIEWQSEVGLAGYKGSDFNLNGQVQNDDKNIYWNGNVGKGTQVP